MDFVPVGEDQDHLQLILRSLSPGTHLRPGRCLGSAGDKNLGVFRSGEEPHRGHHDPPAVQPNLPHVPQRLTALRWTGDSQFFLSSTCSRNKNRDLQVTGILKKFSRVRFTSGRVQPVHGAPPFPPRSYLKDTVPRIAGRVLRKITGRGEFLVRTWPGVRPDVEPCRRSG